MLPQKHPEGTTQEKQNFKQAIQFPSVSGFMIKTK